ncbi:hypothetical protein HYU96_04515 [Candidatus Daviesbacteria bacterium]|nr:hypothetical protein [Candidatus Daviesbacteria bacterium]
MPTATPADLLVTKEFLLVVKIAILIILAFYAIFALMVIRQVDLMSKTLITQVSPILSAFSILHAGVAIGLIVLAWGIL